MNSDLTGGKRRARHTPEQVALEQAVMRAQAERLLPRFGAERHAEPALVANDRLGGGLDTLAAASEEAPLATAKVDTKLLELTKSDLEELSEEHPKLFEELELSVSKRSSN